MKKIKYIAFFMFGLLSCNNYLYWPSVAKAEESESSSKDQDAKKAIEVFKAAVQLYEQKKWTESANAFLAQLNTKNNLQEYILFYLAKSQLALGQSEDAKKNLNSILKMSPNIKMQLEANNLLGEIALDKKQFKEAKNYFQKLEKRTRRTETYPHVIYNLATAEKSMGQLRQSCRWLLQLYTDYPMFEKANSVSENLKPCSISVGNFRDRIRSLQRMGQDQKAQEEIKLFNSHLQKTDPFAADQIQAQFFIQEGELQKALDLLKPHYDQKKKDFNYLMQMALAAARSGDVQLAVSSYYSAYQLNPKSKSARQALYQSAFLSYQFQDYEGATKRFNEFLKVYKNSSLTKDVRWHLAWLQYLKGNYEESFKDFSALLKQRGSKSPADRINYWRAMSLYRQQKYEQAKPIFEKLSNDKLMGFYSLASQGRLQKIAEYQLAQKKEAPQINSEEVKPYSGSLPIQARRVARFSSQEFLLPSMDSISSEGQSLESEEDYVIGEFEEDEKSNEDTADLENNTEQKQLEIVDTDSVPFSNPVLLARFERARDLAISGLDEWARWDLYDIERKTSQRDYLRILMSEYTNIDQYHRSSSIAQIYFGSQRAHYGILGARYLWEFTYPKAYSNWVQESAKKTNVPESLIWGIMKAESQFKKDALSPVGALGLMQIMPYTGQKLAILMKDKTFQTQSLLEPATSIKMGSFYLRRLMNKFEDLTPLVAASYNAGPHRVKNWIISFGHLDMDEFIDHIPFLETRNYVKKVVSYSYVYNELYADKKQTISYLSNPLGVKPQPSIVTKEPWDDI